MPSGTDVTKSLVVHLRRVAHGLANTVAALGGAVEMLARALPPDLDSSDEELIEEIRENAAKARAQVRSLEDSLDRLAKVIDGR